MRVQQESENPFSNQIRSGRLRTFIPDTTHEILHGWQAENQSFGNWPTFYPQLRFTILREGPERLAMIADVTEGIENLLYRAAANNGTFEGFMEEVKSKRYTWTRLQRMLTHIFTGFTYDIRSTMKTPSYLRLLGMTTAGRLYLNEHKKRLKLPLVSKAAAFSNPSLDFDIHASDMYALGIGNGTSSSESVLITIHIQLLSVNRVEIKIPFNAFVWVSYHVILFQSK